MIEGMVNERQKWIAAGLAALALVGLGGLCLLSGAGVYLTRRPAALVPLTAGALMPTPAATLPETASPSRTPAVGPTGLAGAATRPAATAAAAALQIGDPLSATLTLIAATLLPAPNFAAGGGDVWCLPWNAPAQPAQVTDVLDGVTIEVDVNGVRQQVRYIGVSLLDYTQDDSLWSRALAANRRLVQGQRVTLISDVQLQDDQGRWLRYVLAQGRFVNADLAAAGYVSAASAPPNTRCDALLLEAEGRALAGSLGLWQPTSTATRTLIPLPSPTIGNVGLATITFLVQRGSLWREPEEFVEIRNDSDGPLNLENWTLNDEDRHVFTFPRFILGEGQMCRVYTNEYHAKSCGFSFNSPSPIWDNDGECAYLKDPLGRVVSTFCYN